MNYATTAVTRTGLRECVQKWLRSEKTRGVPDEILGGWSTLPYPITGELPVTCQESGRLRQVVNALQLVVESWSRGHHERHANAHDVGDWFSEAVPRSSGFPAKAPGLILRELW